MMVAAVDLSQAYKPAEGETADQSRLMVRLSADKLGDQDIANLPQITDWELFTPFGKTSGLVLAGAGNASHRGETKAGPAKGNA